MVPVQCPSVESPTEPPPSKPQPIVVEKTPLNSQTNKVEQLPYPPPLPQFLLFPSSAPAAVLTSPPPPTPAPRRRKSLMIKRPNSVSSLLPPLL